MICKRLLPRLGLLSAFFATALGVLGPVERAQAQAGNPGLPERREAKPVPPSKPDPAKPDAAVQKAPPRPAPPVPATNLTLTATATRDGPKVTSGLSWRIYAAKADAPNEPVGEPVWSGGGAEAQIRLPNGLYVAEVRHGVARGRKPIRIDEGATVSEVIALDAGLLAARALAMPGGAVLSPAFFSVFEERPGGERRELSRSMAEPATFNLSAGRYILRAEFGLASLETPISVEAGKVTAADLALNVGTLALQTFAAGGAPKLLPSHHNVYPADSPASERAKPLMRIAGATHSVMLPEGRYRIESIAGLAKQETTVTIAAGQTTAHSVILNAGELKISAPIAGGPETCAIAKAGLLGQFKAEPLGRTSGPNASFILPEGRYRLTCHPAGQPKTIRQWTGEVKAGEIIEATPQA